MSKKQTAIIRLRPAFTVTDKFFIRCFLSTGETVSLFERDILSLRKAGYDKEIIEIEFGKVIHFSRTPIPVHIQKKGEYWNITNIEPRTNQQPDEVPSLNLNAVRETAVQLARRTLHAFENEGAVTWDTETTGLDYLMSEIIQFGYTTHKGGTHFFNMRPPENALDSLSPTSPAYLVHGLGESQLRQCPSFEQEAPTIYSILNAKVWVGYNLPFDATLLTYKFWQLGLTTPISISQVDVMTIAAMFFQQWDADREVFLSPKLSEVAEHFGHKFNAHNAGNDSLATLHILKSIAEEKVQS